VKKLEEWYASWAVNDIEGACSINKSSYQFNLKWIVMGALFYLLMNFIRGGMFTILRAKYISLFAKHK